MPDLAISAAHEHEPTFGDYVALLKPRVMSLVVFTALVGLLVAPVSLHAVEAVAAMLFIAIGAGAAGALNMWYDADIDSIMRRTMKRPVPSGRVAPKEALAIGVGLSGLSVVMLGLATNMLAASLLAVTISYYVVIYTMWLKRRTPQNIVIGGAAGAFPPMIGWAAATGSVSMEACLMFALIFIWTPPHFWALALFMRSDYENAGVPMLTVTHGRPAARRHVLAYALLLVPVSLWIALGPIGGPVSLAASVVLNLMFVWGAVQICRRDETAAQGDGYAAERAFFRASLLYLFLHFGAFLADAVMRQAL
ncbi:MAG: protoheme IX farnesyltransferase [Boseongicola sp. SB0676_bin_33]|uniref:Protoheme IX farnesyltransferase n=1 Tax=Boseongicola sp. SB0664_bin_43 TaxID=2604844 RepID=A0A6B0XY34_9RHOB|nr:protoheme IX farnesyltransferase [Boseongicola sp. SB0664_bin_43]MYF88611.1 protoheme IX farnesyltransferase [Boseongicola sp. SB0676_bin_33]